MRYSETPELQARYAAMSNWLQPGILVQATPLYLSRIRQFVREYLIEGGVDITKPQRVVEVRFGGSGRRDIELGKRMSPTQLAFQIDGAPKMWFSPITFEAEPQDLWTPVD